MVRDGSSFLALDVETANADMSSICAIGVAMFAKNEIVNEWYSLVNPETEFDFYNTKIHGLTEADVSDAPTFREISTQLNTLLTGQIVVTHTHFDRTALQQAAGLHSIGIPSCTWLDSARVVRRTWSELSQKGYGIGKVAKMLGLRFKHHNALEDAKIAGAIVLSAMGKTGLSIEDWVIRVQQPINLESFPHGSRIKLGGNPEGPLAGEVIAFTGSLQIPRREAAELAAQLGCEVSPGVTRKTTILVVGDIDITRLAGHEKSTKHRKAEDLISQGAAIKIVRETDFLKLVSLGV
jgi:DNA polymerase III subunit epsilon